MDIKLIRCAYIQALIKLLILANKVLSSCELRSTVNIYVDRESTISYNKFLARELRYHVISM